MMIVNDDGQNILVIVQSINDLHPLDYLQPPDPLRMEKEEDLHSSFVHYSKMDCKEDAKEKKEKGEKGESLGGRVGMQVDFHRLHVHPICH